MSDDFPGIAGWRKYSYIDFPEVISTILFFGGCNLRCGYCHNPDIVFNRLPEVSFSEVREFLRKRSGIIEGVVLSGGEPTLQSLLPRIVRELRTEGLKIKIDTNGLNPDMIEKCRPDYLALDIKTAFSKYPELGCRVPGYRDKLSRSLENVKSMGERAEVRITAAPGVIDEDIVVEIAGILKGVSRIFLQRFQSDVNLLDTQFEGITPFSSEKMEYFRRLISTIAGGCNIRGE